MRKVKFTSNLNSVVGGLNLAKETFLNEAGGEISSRAKKVVPVDTGELRDSIDYEVKKDKTIVGAGAKYAPVVELGTSRSKAQPYLKISAESELEKLREVMRSAIAKSMTKR